MKYLPIGLDVRGRICIVVGGGTIGTRKVSNLLRAGAIVTVVSPEVTDEVAHWASSGDLTWVKEEFYGLELEGVLLLVAATNDKELNADLVRMAQERGVLVCDASSASRSEVIFGALHHGKAVTVAVFSDGQDPSLSRRTRNRIAELSDEWEEDEEPC